jgi:hypothetical protein
MHADSRGVILTRGHYFSLEEGVTDAKMLAVLRKVGCRNEGKPGNFWNCLYMTTGPGLEVGKKVSLSESRILDGARCLKIKGGPIRSHRSAS